MRTFKEHMRSEHDILHTMWDMFLSEPDKKNAREKFKEFNTVPLSHISLEEGNISTTFNTYMGIEKDIGPSAVIHQDHIQILKLLKRVREALDSEDQRKIDYSKAHFIRALMKHHKKEEETLYQLFDLAITNKDWEEIISGRI